MVATKSQTTEIATRRGPSPALVRARAEAQQLMQKFTDYRKSKNAELKEVKSIGLADTLIAQAAGAGGAVVTGLGRGLAKRFDVNPTYVDIALGTTAFIGGGVAAYFDFMPGLVASVGMTAPMTADFVENMVAGAGSEDSELDE